MKYIEMKKQSRALLRHLITLQGVTEDIDAIPLSYDDITLGAAELELHNLVSVTRTDKIVRIYVTPQGRRYCEFNPKVKNPPIVWKVVNAILSAVGACTIMWGIVMIIV